MTGGFVALEAGSVDNARLTGHSFIRGPKFLQLPLITVCLLGVQLFWSVEMSYASPYLLSLGLSKANMAIVFLAGPLSGLIMQPVIGVLADANTSRWGRRRPYMIVGLVICIFSVLLLGWTKRVASWFSTSQSLVITLAVVSIYLIDFSINAVQAVDRALLVDILPSSAQPAGNAWAARMLGFGSVCGFFIGNLDLPSLFPLLGTSQLQVFSILAAIFLLVTHLLTAFTVNERVLLPADTTRRGGPLAKSFTNEVKEIFTNLWTLPRVIRQICIIQFFSWIAWFPILFYTTVYVGDIHKQNVLGSLPGGSTQTHNIDLTALDAEAARLGSRALFYSALLTLVANIVLPFFLSETRSKLARTHSSLQNGHATPARSSFFNKFSFLQIDLSSLWTLSQAVLAGCMFATFFTKSLLGATILITLTGFSWAITMWAPLALLGEAILTESTTNDDAASIRLTDTRSHRHHSRQSSSFSVPRDLVRTDLPANGGAASQAEPDSDYDESGSDAEDQAVLENKRKKILGNTSASVSRTGISSDYHDANHHVDGEEAALMSDDVSADDDEDESDIVGGLSSKAGIILGIQNIFVVIPQFLVTGLAAIIFTVSDLDNAVVEPKGSAASPSNGTNTVQTPAIGISSKTDSVVYVLRVGGFSALVAFVLCYRLSRELRHR